MRTLDVEEGLDLVEKEIKEFHTRYDTGSFVLLSCGPASQYVGAGGGAVGALIWACEEGTFQVCNQLLGRLLEQIGKIDWVVDVEVEESIDEDGGVCYIEFAARV